MAISKINGWFSKTGKGVPQTHQKSFEGELQYEDAEKTKPVMGNEQFTCDQLTDDSVSSASDVEFMADVLEACGGDLQKAAKSFREGWNRVTRLEAGASDPYISAAKGLIRLKLENYKGLTVEQIADQLRAANR